MWGPKWQVTDHTGYVLAQFLLRISAETLCEQLNTSAHGTETTYYYERITK